MATDDIITNGLLGLLEVFQVDLDSGRLISSVVINWASKTISDMKSKHELKQYKVLLSYKNRVKYYGDIGKFNTNQTHICRIYSNMVSSF